MITGLDNKKTHPESVRLICLFFVFVVDKIYSVIVIDFTVDDGSDAIQVTISVDYDILLIL